MVCRMRHGSRDREDPLTGLAQQIETLRPALASGGEGVRAVIHAEEPAPLAELVAWRFPAMRIVSVDDYPGLEPAVAALRPQLCLSYKFGPGYPRKALFNGGVLYVHVAGTGFDHLLLFDPKRVLVCNSSGFQNSVMADFALGAIYALNLHLPAFLNDQRRREWRPRTLRSAVGERAAVLGTGPIGAAVAERLRSVGMIATGISRSGRPHPAFDRVMGVDGLTAALAEADHLIVAVPRTPETAGLLSAPVLRVLPRGATVVNMARGGIVDEAALLELLREGHLRGAVFDGFADEPLPADSPLWEAPNLVVTPHTAALFDGWEVAAAERFCNNLDRWGRGEPLLNRVDPLRGY